MRTDKQPVSKVTFDQMGDFKFKVAYEAYSKLFDKAPGIDERLRLNAIISQLFNEEISYHRFYSEIDQYREGPDRSHAFLRVRIQGQKKRDYRREEQKKQRIKRHKR